MVTARVTKRSSRLIETAARVCLKDGTVVAESTAKQFVAASADGQPDKVREMRRHV